MRVRDAWAQAAAGGVDRLDAQLLMCHVLQQPRTRLLAHDEQALSPAQEADWMARVARRAAGEPLAYVLGEWSFCGMALSVSPAVLIPRPETEMLVEWAVERLQQAPSADVVDLGTGSGAIALALARAAPSARVMATDASLAALEVAQANSRRHQLSVTFSAGDWWGAVPGRTFGLAVSNPPYVAPGDPHLAALTHEPILALTAAAAGLQALSEIIQGAPSHLLPGAWLLLEHGHDQAEAVQDLLAQRGFTDAQTRLDLAELPRCTGARWPGVNEFPNARR